MLFLLFAELFSCWFPIFGKLPNCTLCIKPSWNRGSRGDSYFEEWTSLPLECRQGTGRKCIHSGVPYLVWFNLGSQHGPGKQNCPRGVAWVCIPASTGIRKTSAKNMVQRRWWENYKQDISQGYKWSRNKGDIYANARRQAATHRLGDNKWVDLSQQTADLLELKNCWICGGPTRDGTWPWQGEPLDIWQLLRFNGTTNKIERPSQAWHLANHPLGDECIRKGEGRHYKGDSSCKRLKLLKNTTAVWHPATPTWYFSMKRDSDCVLYESMNDTTDIWNCSGNNPYRGIPSLRQIWNQTIPHGYAPEGLYWICGNMAYTFLEPDWSGTCCIGIIQPQFVLLPLQADHHLSTKVYMHLIPQSPQDTRAKRELKIGDWGDDWPPEHIISYYGPATWAQDGSWGYRTPIYMLNPLIRLQAVLEIITNQTATALDLLADEQQQIRATVYQNRLALDYLLAAEGGVCGKLNLTNCCLKIDDNGQAVKNISTGIRKLSHVPVQTWHPWSGMWWTKLLTGDWSWIHTALIAAGLFVLALIIIPCLMPCVQCLIQRALRQVTTTRLMMLRPQFVYSLAGKRTKLNRTLPNGDLLSVAKEKGWIVRDTGM
ncbi:endogenous retrovirus group 3 member 1 Env polyprotein-like [Narcine bancroftii]|uniref:endogenous retrovirus group 3 member 1 Env polyprotein-like n=1 Tax=Narcine bancroftii TaxID=1343680 RepID=UPI003832104D